MPAATVANQREPELSWSVVRCATSQVLSRFPQRCQRDGSPAVPSETCRLLGARIELESDHYVPFHKEHADRVAAKTIALVQALAS